MDEASGQEDCEYSRAPGIGDIQYLRVPHECSDGHSGWMGLDDRQEMEIEEQAQAERDEDRNALPREEPLQENVEIARGSGRHRE